MRGGIRNLAELLRARARGDPSKIALTGSFAPVTFGALDAEADRVARWLRSVGVQAGDRVAVAMPNIPEFAYAYFGTLRAGAVIVPLNYTLTEPEITAIVTDSGAVAALVAPPASPEVFVDAGVGSVVSTDGWDELGPSEGDPVEPVSGGEDLAALPYTSGTTGAPKGVMLSHDNLIAALDQQMAVSGAPDNSDTLLIVLPMFHIFGLNVGLGLLAATGATGALLQSFSPVGSLEAIREHGVTVVFGAPQMYAAWLGASDADAEALSGVRLAVSGAAPLPRDVLAGFKARFGIDIWEGYGLTETAPTLSSALVFGSVRPGSVGRPLPGIEVRLVDERGEDIEPGDPGEIVVRGPNVFTGYWNRREETERAFVDGWFRTGDVAVLDEEGCLYLVDRKRDLIIVSGFNVFPAEVENALLAHPAVAEAAVVGIADQRTGEAVKAFVVLVQGADVREQEILEDVRRRLARFKCPRSVAVVERLPHLPTGKVLRRALRN